MNKLKILKRNLHSKPDVAPPKDDTTPRPSDTPSGPMMRARTKALRQEVKSLLTMLDPNLPLNDLLPHQNSLCVIRYISEEDPQGIQAIKGGEERGKEKLEQTGARTAVPDPAPERNRSAGTRLVSPKMLTVMKTDKPEPPPVLAPECPNHSGAQTGCAGFTTGKRRKQLSKVFCLVTLPFCPWVLYILLVRPDIGLD
jgi:hypothetical protein